MSKAGEDDLDLQKLEPHTSVLVGGSHADRAADQQERPVAIVRDIDRANWEEASRRLAEQVMEDGPPPKRSKTPLGRTNWHSLTTSRGD